MPLFNIIKRTVRSKAAFTLVETAAVVAIIGILTAIAVPTMLGVIERSKQTNRMNIARTIYLAAQDQLTRSKLEKNLSSIWESGILIDQDGIPEDCGDNLRYISKAKGLASGELYDLLSEIVIDKQVLSDAVLIEYDKETGVVLSAFYGDTLENGASFQYDGTAGDADITGGRGMNPEDGGYESAAGRKQGYYGVASAGGIPEEIYPEVLNIYDGAEKPLDGKRNILYAELNIPKRFQEGGAAGYTFELIGAKTSVPVGVEITPDFSVATSEFYLYSDNLLSGDVEVYGAAAGRSYNRYIWVIDYIEGDLINGGQPQSIGVRYGDELTEPQDIRVRALRNGDSTGVKSVTAANTHFGAGSNAAKGEFVVKSARHLNNIRYAPDKNFRQTEDIAMQTGELSAVGEIKNFTPIIGVGGEAFSGKYSAVKYNAGVYSQYRITGLTIDTTGLAEDPDMTEPQNTGLFAEVSGTVEGMLLFEAEIITANGENTGAIAGSVTDGGKITRSGSYANVKSSGTGINTGGLAGIVAGGGMITESFGAGFYNTLTDTQTENGFGSVTAKRGNIGGLAGANYGTIQNSFNNARVNIANTQTAGGSSYNPLYTEITGAALLGGITGDNQGTVKNTYFTNYIAVYNDRDDSASGGIAGNSVSVPENSFFILNGCKKNPGGVTKTELKAKLGVFGAFKSGGITNPAAFGVYRNNYPYPILKNNNPLGESYNWGWEDIEEIDTNARLLYYERYSDGSFGYSAGGTPLAGPSSGKLAANDGYALEFNYVREMEITVDDKIYTLKSGGNAANPLWEWSGVSVPSNLPVWNETSGKFLMFFENSFIESFGGQIEFIVTVAESVEAEHTFNPLFADTVDKTGGSFAVRSPRHLNNIGNALDSDYEQRLNIDFNVYRKEFTRITAETSMNGISLSGYKMTYPGSAVISGEFTGVYAGGGFFIRSAAARYGIFETVTGTVRSVTLRDSVFTGTGAESGGITAVNDGNIELCAVLGTVVQNTAAGGIAGINSGIIEKSAVQYSTVESDTDTGAGGVAGLNSGEIRDVYFLSMAELSASPVSGGGGIAGTNSGEIIRALYLAPAPAVTEITGTTESGADITATTLYPIVRDGETTKIDGKETCFYLAGHRYTLDKGITWKNERYSLSRIEPNIQINGGGRGLVTKFIDLEWISYAYHIGFENWNQPAAGYPYPNIRGLSVPVNWPVADSPARPDQVDTDLWTNYLSTSGRALAPNLANSGFIDEFLTGLPLSPGADNSIVPPYRQIGNHWFTLDMSAVNGWYTRPLDHELFNQSNRLYYFPAVGVEDFMQGYSTSNVPRWRIIEFQEPNGSDDFMRTNYLGQRKPRNQITPENSVRSSSYRYAELNAETPGTLYQVLPTTPGAQFYYSFYHATNGYPGYNPGDWYVAPDSYGDRMHFYLTGFEDGDSSYIVSSTSQANIRDAAMVMIRPCESPRIAPANAPGANASPGANVIWNPSAWNTVAYGASDQAQPTSGKRSGGPYDLSYHRGKSYLQPTGTEVVQDIPEGRIYLYDVWIGDTSTTAANGGIRGGYGISFWSERNVSLNTNGYADIGNMPSSVRTDARNNVIGYWGVQYGWKHYYGVYTVPEGQTMTEFSYQSKSGPTRVKVGNYLDGISFKAPAFLSVDKFVKDETGSNIKFVKPGDDLTVELNIKNWGEITADKIVITDRLTPFDQYIDFGEKSAGGIIDGRDTVTVKKGTQTISGVLTEYADGVITITLPDDTRLGTNEQLSITFSLRVRNNIYDNEDAAETLLYYFRNQAAIEFCEDSADNSSKFTAYKDRISKNASGPEPVQVFIDPVRLTKTVTTSGGLLIDGPFTVTLAVENTLEGRSIETDGLINDVIPKGFELVSGVSFRINGEDGAVFEYTTELIDDSTRITIPNVGLSTEIKKVECSYTLEYTGSGHGVAYIASSADYKYMYDEGGAETLSVLLKFPQPVVGLRIKTQADSFEAGGTGTHVFDITANDNLKERLAEDNYDVTPELVLCDSSGNPADLVIDGNYTVDNEAYRAVLVRGNNNLEFTPKDGANGIYELYYQIKLDAKKAGGTPENFALSSSVTKITVYVAGGDTLVYYEKYDDGSYGFYAADNAPVPDPLDDEKDITESGYGVFSAARAMSISLDGETNTAAAEPCRGGYLYKLDIAASDNLRLLNVSFGDTENMNTLGKIHPNFAKAVYGADTETGNIFYIRTREQLENIKLITDTTDIEFVTERGITPGEAEEDEETVPPGGEMPALDYALPPEPDELPEPEETPEPDGSDEPDDSDDSGSPDGEDSQLMTAARIAMALTGVITNIK